MLEKRFGSTLEQKAARLTKEVQHIERNMAAALRLAAAAGPFDVTRRQRQVKLWQADLARARKRLAKAQR